MHKKVFEASEDFQGMTIKTEALVPMPVILTQEEYQFLMFFKSSNRLKDGFYCTNFPFLSTT